MDINYTAVFEIIGICLAIAGIWWGFLKAHTINLRDFYGKIAMPMDKVKDAEQLSVIPKRDRLLKLFFYRQITYEFSAYALLIICIGFLLGCLYIFLQAGTFVKAQTDNQPLDTNQYLISLLSIRIGITLVVFFICQVLLKLYRYCLRFTAFYTGLFDALFICDDLEKDFEAAAKLFTIDKELESAPESPTDKVIEILKSLK